MMIEFSLLPLGRGSHISGEIAEALKIVDTSGLPYQLTPAGTCLEGDWDQVMPVIRKCHDAVRARTPHVVTMIKIEDEAGQSDKMMHNIASVEEKVGHRLRREQPADVVAG